MQQDSSIVALAARLREEVTLLHPGDRLPSSRTLTERHRVSPVTVSRALGLLSTEGLIVTRPGSGTYVAERPRAAHAPGPPDLDWQSVALGGRSIDDGHVVNVLTPPPDGVIGLNGGYLSPSLQPTRALTTALARVGRRPDAWERPPLAGVTPLRAWFARATGGDVSPADVLVTHGGQAAITITLRALLPPDAPLLVESPTYPGALAAARAAGLHPVPVPVDDQGVRTDLLADAFGVTGARAFLCQPTFQNPTGVVLSAERRQQVLAVARAAGAFVIEDDFARHLAFEPGPPSLVSLDRDGTVVHISSLTKATAPSLRIGAVIARGPAAERIRSAQLVDTFFAARPLQETALELVSSPAWPRHLRAIQTALRSRRDVLATAVARELSAASLTAVPTGGPYLWVRLPAGVDDVALTEAALRAGVLVGAGRPYFPAEPPGPYLRLSYCNAATESELTEGMRRLATVCP